MVSASSFVAAGLSCRTADSDAFAGGPPPATTPFFSFSRLSVFQYDALVAIEFDFSDAWAIFIRSLIVGDALVFRRSMCHCSSWYAEQMIACCFTAAPCLYLDGYRVLIRFTPLCHSTSGLGKRCLPVRRCLDVRSGSTARSGKLIGVTSTAARLRLREPDHRCRGQAMIP